VIFGGAARTSAAEMTWALRRCDDGNVSEAGVSEKRACHVLRAK
jgi:hypothetical protein